MRCVSCSHLVIPYGIVDNLRSEGSGARGDEPGTDGPHPWGCTTRAQRTLDASRSAAKANVSSALEFAANRPGIIRFLSLSARYGCLKFETSSIARSDAVRASLKGRWRGPAEPRTPERRAGGSEALTDRSGSEAEKPHERRAPSLSPREARAALGLRAFGHSMTRWPLSPLAG